MKTKNRFIILYKISFRYDFLYNKSTIIHSLKNFDEMARIKYRCRISADFICSFYMQKL